MARNYRKQVLGSATPAMNIGGELNINSGGEIDIESGGSLKIGGVAMTGTAAELNALAGVTAGTITASKAVVVSSSKDAGDFRYLLFADSGGIKLGADDDATLLHDGTKSVTLTIADDAAAAFAIKESTNSYMTIVTTNSGEKVVVHKILELLGGAGSPASSANGLLMGVGTSGSPATTSTADKSFMEFRTESTATSGDSRCLYMRHALNGAGISGESLRSFSKITAAANTCRGAHISLDIGAGGSCSGLGAGVDSQVLALDAALTGGTYTAQNIEWYAAGASTDISGVTQSSFIRCVLNGNATGLANIEDNVNLMAIAGGTIAAGNMFAAKTAAAVTHTLRCNMYGTTYYLMVSDTQ